MFSQWLFWTGVACFIIGLILLSPLADFLPVGFWDKLKQLFTGDQASRHVYLRVARGKTSRTIEFFILVAGLVLMAISLFL